MPVLLDERPLAVHGEQLDLHSGGDADVAASQIRRLKHERILQDDGVLRVFQQAAVIRRRRRRGRRGWRGRRIVRLGKQAHLYVSVHAAVAHHRPTAVDGDQLHPHPLRHAQARAEYAGRLIDVGIFRDDDPFALRRGRRFRRRRRRGLGLVQRGDVRRVHIGVHACRCAPSPNRR